MAKSKSLLCLLISVLLLFKIFTFTSLPQQSNLPRTIILNLAFLGSKRHHDDVFPAMGLSPYTRKSDGGGKTLQPPVFNGNDVVVLSEQNFSNFMAKNRHVVVIFYRWRVAAEHAALAKKLTGASVVAKVDMDEQHSLAEKYEIMRSPVVYFFPGGADLGDKYFNECIQDLDSWDPVKGKHIGKSVRLSDEDAEEGSSTGHRQPILEVADHPKIANRKRIYEDNGKWEELLLAKNIGRDVDQGRSQTLLNAEVDDN